MQTNSALEAELFAAQQAPRLNTVLTHLTVGQYRIQLRAPQAALLLQFNGTRLNLEQKTSGKVHYSRHRCYCTQLLAPPTVTASPSRQAFQPLHFTDCCLTCICCRMIHVLPSAGSAKKAVTDR